MPCFAEVQRPHGEYLSQSWVCCPQTTGVAIINYQEGSVAPSGLSLLLRYIQPAVLLQPCRFLSCWTIPRGNKGWEACSKHAYRTPCNGVNEYHRLLLPYLGVDVVPILQL